jgi:AhpD family alkylhydroperoxidase
MPVLSEKDNEVIAIAASVAAGCVPCTTFHIRAAGAIGVASEEISQAAREAVRVRLAATSIMAGHGGVSPSGPADPDRASGASRSLILELAAIGAAYAVSCTASLEDHLDAARREGADDAQILTALKIACAIRDVAGQKAKATAAHFLGASEADSCDCPGGDLMPGAAAPRKSSGRPEDEGAGGCSCGSDNE